MSDDAESHFVYQDDYDDDDFDDPLDGFDCPAFMVDGGLYCPAQGSEYEHGNPNNLCGGSPRCCL